jgi:hypothetical protein
VKLYWRTRGGVKRMHTELIDKYIEGQRETLELLSKPEWLKIIKKGKQEVAKESKGKSLDELED